MDKILRTKLLDPAQPVFPYGTTPPRNGASDEEIETAAGKLVERLGRLALDALVVYDVQDESSRRTSVPRPFPFLPTLDSRLYARRLSGLTGPPAITYRCVAAMDEVEWEAELAEAGDTYQLRYLAPVGAPSSQGMRLLLSRATQIATAHRSGFTLAGVAITERHSPARSESRRMLQKARDGCTFFVSQGVYHSDSKSIEICCANLRPILEHHDPAAVPLGVNVESVSIRKDEIDATIDLFQALREIASVRY